MSAVDMSGWQHCLDALRGDAASVGLSEADAARLVSDAREWIAQCVAAGMRGEDIEVVFMSERRGHGRLLVGRRDCFALWNRGERRALRLKRRRLH